MTLATRGAAAAILSSGIIVGLAAAGRVPGCFAGEPVPGPAAPATAAAMAPAPAPAAAPAMIRVLSIEQEAKGLPDLERGQVLRQKVLLDSAGNRIQLISYKKREESAPADRPLEVERRIILRMSVDPPEITEVWDEARAYRKTTRDLNRVQEDRDQWDLNTLRRLPELSAAERKAILEENFLRTDGQRIVEIAPTGRKEKVLGREAEEIKVFENGRTIIQAWVTKEIPGARKFYNLYRKLGAFSAQVLDRVSQIDAFPLKADITVVTAAPSYTISASCLEVKDEDVPAASFEVPQGYRERREEPGAAACETCKKPVEPDEAKAKIQDVEAGRTLYFDSIECRNAYLKGRRQKAAGSGGPGAEGAPVPTPAPAPAPAPKKE